MQSRSLRFQVARFQSKRFSGWVPLERAHPATFRARWRLGAEAENFWNCCLVPPFFRVFQALMLSQQNLGLEFNRRVMYYLSARRGVVPHDAKPPNHLLVSLTSHSYDNYSN